MESAREQGAEVRERCSVEDALLAGRPRRRACATATPRASEREVALPRSSSAPTAGARPWPRWSARGAPYRLSRNGRGLVFRYLEDPLAGTSDAETYYQWREGNTFAFAFPTTPAGRLLVLLDGPPRRGRRGPSRPRGLLAAQARRASRARRAGRPARRPGSKLRSTGETPAFFRASSGPGWALAGDAGHFKDPVTGQGMRDAMFAGRTLAEQVLPVLDDPAAVDRATRGWEADRDRECLPAYHFANADTRIERPSPALCELVRDGREDDRART